MKAITILDNQELIDIAMQELGDVERVFELCLLNNLSLTAVLNADDIILVPDFDQDKKRIVTQFSHKSLAPASGDDMVLLVESGGIGFMQIGNNFKVS